MSERGQHYHSMHCSNIFVCGGALEIDIKPKSSSCPYCQRDRILFLSNTPGRIGGWFDNSLRQDPEIV